MNALLHGRCGNGGGDAAAGPLSRRAFQPSPRQQQAGQQASVVKRSIADQSAQLRAISLEYTHSELLAATLNWHPSRKLGTGCYGAVYRGELRDGSEVAIKAIDLGAIVGKGESPEDAGFDEEVQMLSKFRHPNLVTLLGWGQHEMSRYLVYELLAGGDVFHRLHRSRRPGAQRFPWNERLSVLLDASTGLSHLHNSTPKAFHRDIKSANILVDRHGTAKMADFGLSCTSGQRHVTTKTINGTPGYKCPLYERSGCFTEGSEVFSFCMVVLEVLTGLDPSAADRKSPSGICFPLEEAISLGRPGAAERCVQHADALAGWPQSLAKEVATLAIRGTSTQDERTRPSFVEIVPAVRGMSERFSSSRPVASEPLPRLQSWAGPALQEAAPQAQPASQQQAAQLAPAQGQPKRLRSPCTRANSRSGSASASSRAAVHAHMLEAARCSGRATTGTPASVAVEAQAPGDLSAPLTLSHAPASATGSAAAAPAANAVAAAIAEAGAATAPTAAGESLGGSSPSPAAIDSPPFHFEVVSAPGSNVEALPHDSRRLPLQPCHAVGLPLQLIASVGRKHQPGLFESWLPDANRCSCISRTAFEVTWSPGVDGVWLTARGSNPMSVDAKVARNGSSVPLRSGAEIRFTFDLRVILALRFINGGQSSTLIADGSSAEAVAPGRHGSITSSVPSPMIGPRTVSMCQQAENYAASAGTSVASADVPTLLWSVSQTCRLEITDNSIDQLRNQVQIIEDVDSVSVAVDKLNSGAVSCRQGFCAVRSAAQKAWFLLYRKGMGEAGLAILGNTVEDSAMPALPQPASRPAAATAVSATVAVARGGTASTRQARSLEPPIQPRRHSEWSLECIHTDGISTQTLDSMPAEVRCIEVFEGTVLLGRQHQPDHFEAWLPDAALRFCISRTHLQLAVCRGGLRVTNLSTSLLCVDQEPMAKGEVRPLSDGQILSFARHDNGVHVQFLALRIHSNRSGSVARRYYPGARVCSTHRRSVDTRSAETPGRSGAAASHSVPPNSTQRWRNRPSPPSSPRASPGRSSPSYAPVDEASGSLVASRPPDCRDAQAQRSVAGGGTSSARRMPALAPTNASSSGGLPQQPPPVPRGPASVFGAAPPQAVMAASSTRVPSVAGTPPPAATVPQNSCRPRRQASSGQLNTPVPEQQSGPVANGTDSGLASMGTSLSNCDLLPEAVSDNPRVLLELSGDVVLSSPPSGRRWCIGPTAIGDQPLLVGSRHQPELYRRALTEEGQDMLSRDHFCIAHEDGEFWLLAVAPDRIWLLRGGSPPTQLQRDSITTLRRGDCIALSSDRGDAAPWPLLWHFHEVGSDAAAAETAR